MIYGNSIKSTSGMSNIRSVMGVCPQVQSSFTDIEVNGTQLWLKILCIYIEIYIFFHRDCNMMCSNLHIFCSLIFYGMIYQVENIYIYFLPSKACQELPLILYVFNDLGFLKRMIFPVLYSCIWLLFKVSPTL